MASYIIGGIVIAGFVVMTCVVLCPVIATAATMSVSAGSGASILAAAKVTGAALTDQPNTSIIKPASETARGALVRYDADFAAGQLTGGGRATASQLDEFGAAQGWTRGQSATGPLKYEDGNGIARLTIKRGSDRAPGSGSPHVEIRNDAGLRVDPYGHLVTRSSLGNHTPIEWNLP